MSAKVQALRDGAEERALALMRQYGRPEIEKSRRERDDAIAEKRRIAAEVGQLDARLRAAEAEIQRERTARVDADRATATQVSNVEAAAARYDELSAAHEREMRLLRDGYKAVERRHNDILGKLDKLLQLELKEVAPMPVAAPPPMYARIEAVRDGNGLVRAWKLIPKD